MENEMKSPNQKKILVGLALVILAVISLSYLPNLFLPGPDISALCNKFPKITGEISCEEAAEIALAKYPGKIYLVNITQMEMPALNEEFELEDVWLIGIYLNESQFEPATKKLEIKISKASGKIINLRPIY